MPFLPYRKQNHHHHHHHHHDNAMQNVIADILSLVVPLLLLLRSFDLESEQVV